MTLHHAIWTVGAKPSPLAPATLPSEQLLKKMIIEAPALLSDAWMLIGQEVTTSHGGRIDLLAVAPDGALVLIELKRDRTPRDVVAQALDYASWVESLQPEAIATIYAKYLPNRSISADFQARFGQPLDEETLNQSHQIVIVAAALDADSERIVQYLAARGIAINVLCFQVFEQGGQQLLSRAWLMDPSEAPVAVQTTPGAGKEPWNGEYYASFGAGPSRSWDDAMTYGFISAGGGSWYSNTLRLLHAGDRIWVKAPDYGFVGVGRVVGEATPAAAFRVQDANGAEVAVLDVAKGGTYHRDFVADPEKCEYFVAVEWLDKHPLSKAVKEVGLFGNQNTVCRPISPKWRSTVEVLKRRFSKY